MLLVLRHTLLSELRRDQAPVSFTNLPIPGVYDIQSITVPDVANMGYLGMVLR